MELLASYENTSQKRYVKLWKDGSKDACFIQHGIVGFAPEDEWYSDSNANELHTHLINEGFKLVSEGDTSIHTIVPETSGVSDILDWLRS